MFRVAAFLVTVFGLSMATAQPVPFLTAAESATTVLAGRVGPVEKVDQHGFSTTLSEVESVKAGNCGPRIAWEELSAARPPRFARGKHVIVVLEPAAGSIWNTRFPDGPPCVVAEHGNAFLESADPDSVASLRAYLTSPADQASKIAALITLLTAPSPVAVLAVDRLGAISDLDAQITPDARTQLADRLRKAPPEVARGIATLAAAKKLTLLRDALTKTAKLRPPLAEACWRAVGETEGVLRNDESRNLIRRREATLRAIGVQYAPPEIVSSQLPSIVRQDRDATVRAAAAQVLATRGGSAEQKAALVALADREAVVRAQAAQAIGGIGAPIVPALEKKARAGKGTEAQTAVLALSFAGAAGQKPLLGIAASHPVEEMRNLASLALGKIPEHH